VSGSCNSALPVQFFANAKKIWVTLVNSALPMGKNFTNSCVTSFLSDAMTSYASLLYLCFSHSWSIYRTHLDYDHKCGLEEVWIDSGIKDRRRRLEAVKKCRDIPGYCKIIAK
jgi:hypothetical protein